LFISKWEPPYPEYWEQRRQFRYTNYLDSSADMQSVLRQSDFYSLLQLKNLPFYVNFARDVLGVYALSVPLPAPPGKIRRLNFCRGVGSDFNDRDLLVLRLLRPHLQQIYLDAERRRRGIPQLSGREREVLQLVAQGYSNADIARILFISPATVAKHMEHIFDRTGVRTRSAAAALALPSPLSLRPLHGK
jgi:DNA-binding CsgD family transcriptional regulator